jgi:Protein of unknown function (DUF3460)
MVHLIFTPAASASATGLSAAHRTMPLFWKHYKSDTTALIEDLKAKKPHLEAQQRQGRALLWDKRVDRQALSEYSQASVPQQPYVYGSKPG